jgi:hypothetical protein
MLASYSPLQEAREFKKHFLSAIALYVVFLLFEYFAGLSGIGILGQIFSVIILIYFGIKLYKSRPLAGAHSLSTYLAFVTVLLMLDFFGQSLLSILIPEISIAFAVKSFLIILFWVCFLNYWGRERTLPQRSFAYLAATSVYSITFNIFAIIYLVYTQLL